MIERIGYVPDEKVELYFKAADVLVLPYAHIFQSGVLFLRYSFGLPVIATDVGSLREEIIEGKTGFVCRAGDASSLATAMEAHFSSDLFQGLAGRRQDIRDYAKEGHSWAKVGAMTARVNSQLLEE